MIYKISKERVRLTEQVWVYISIKHLYTTCDKRQITSIFFFIGVLTTAEVEFQEDN